MDRACCMNCCMYTGMSCGQKDVQVENEGGKEQSSMS